MPWRGKKWLLDDLRIFLDGSWDPVDSFTVHNENNSRDPVYDMVVVAGQKKVRRLKL